MICPVDGSEMHAVKIVSHYGQLIILEQCQKCGGIWFDESELFRAKQGEADKIESLDVEGLLAPSSIQAGALVCPKDKAALVIFKDRYFPKDLILARCPSCRGIWLNRGQFSKYQRFRQELQRAKETSPADKKLEERVAQLMESYQSGRSSDTLGRLGNFLSTPVDDTPFASDSGAAPAAANAVSLTLNIIFSILRAVFLRY